MIFKLKFNDKTEYATAKTGLHLVQEYYKAYGEDFLLIEEITILLIDETKTIMLKCEEEIDPISLYDLAIGVYEDFAIVGSTYF